MKASIVIGVGFLLAANAAFAGGGSEPLTAGWDAFPAINSGSVTWNIAAGSRDFSATYLLGGVAGNVDHMVGMHHFDARIPILFGGGTTTVGSTPSSITREGNTSNVVDTTFGFVAVDGAGATNTGFTFSNVNPGVYNVQFHVRDGGAPGCPDTSCNAIFRSGSSFATDLTRFAVPGAIAFWSGDGDASDEVGPNDLTPFGSVAFRSGHFRQGFDLAGTGHLQHATPAAAGIAPTSGFTVLMWIEQDVFSNAASVINLRTLANSSGFTLEPQFNVPGSFLFALNTDGLPSGFKTLEPSGFPFGQRFAIAASFDAATHTMRVYRDDVIVAERTDVPGTGMALLGGEVLQIGHNIVNGGSFDGLIDDVLLFDRALTRNEIFELLDVRLFGNGFD